MRATTSLKIIIACLWWQTSEAAAVEGKPKARKAVAKPRTSDGYPPGSSGSNRLGKTIVLLTDTFNFSAGYYVTSDLVASVDYGEYYQLGGKVWRSISSFRSKYEVVDSVDYGIHADYFLGNSFYVTSGISYESATWIRNSSARLSPDSKFKNSETTPHKVVDRKIALNIGIGNRWQWENFTIGCEWIGINTAIVNFGQRYDFSDYNNESPEDFRARFEEDMGPTLRNTVTEDAAFEVQFGASF